MNSFAQLKVSADKRHLKRTNGKPFFWLGDTAWELFHRLNREEAILYLQNRADKGFTVIQAVVLAELDGLKTPNAYGDKPLLNNDLTKPNPQNTCGYFRAKASETDKPGKKYTCLKTTGRGHFIGMANRHLIQKKSSALS